MDFADKLLVFSTHVVEVSLRCTDISCDPIDKHYDGRFITRSFVYIKYNTLKIRNLLNNPPTSHNIIEPGENLSCPRYDHRRTGNSFRDDRGNNERGYSGWACFSSAGQTVKIRAVRELSYRWYRELICSTVGGGNAQLVRLLFGPWWYIFCRQAFFHVWHDGFLLGSSSCRGW